MVSFADEQSFFPFEKLRVIPFQFYNGAFNMALDYYLASTLTENDDPVLRFYGWQPSCLSIGFHQSRDEVEFDALKKAKYDLVRRPTGGSAIFHSRELTYSVIVPLSKINHHSFYKSFHQVLASAIQNAGYAVSLHNRHSADSYLNKGGKTFACFNRPAFTEIIYDGKKLVGSAQKLFKKMLLQHGSILIGDQQNQIIDFLNVEETGKEKFRRLIKEKSIALNQINDRDISETELSNYILDEIHEKSRISTFMQDLTKNELTNVEKFINQFEIY